jgi:hypothetical protein
MYLYSTYEPYAYEDPEHWWGFTNFFIHFLFMIEYVLTIISAQDWKKYVLSLDSILDVTSTIPFLIIRMSYGNPLVHEFNQPTHIFAEFLDMLRIVKIEKLTLLLKDEIYRNLSSITITILSLVVITSGFV